LKIDEKLGNRLKEMDCHQLREGLFAEEFTSVDLVNYFGDRC